MKTDRITDENGIYFLIEKPNEGQMCQTKLKGEAGYHSESKYINGWTMTSYLSVGKSGTITANGLYKI